MKHSVFPQVKEVLDALRYRPSVSIILPFSAKIALRTELQKEIKYALDKATRLLKEQYPDSLTLPVIEKLHALTQDLKIPAGKLGMALYVSPVFGNVYFLDALPPERVVVDESFEIRDLLFSQKQIQPYILFLLSSEKCKLLFCDGREFLPVKMDSPSSLDAYWSDETERVANFSDPVVYKTNQIEKFMRQMDKELIHLVQQRKYPVFLMGSRTILGLYMSITHAKPFIKGSVEGNFESASPVELQIAIRSEIRKWRKGEEASLLRQIDEAAGQRKLACGIEAVWKDAYDKKGRLLIVEKGFVAAGEHVSGGKIVYKPTGTHNDFHVSNDIVDDVMELVLKNGGDVAFTDDGVLASCGHIALINYFE